jgi:threonyl-tRNA synthetase
LKVLQLHCSEFDYKVTKETPVAEHPANLSEARYENVLVCFTCYEKQDESRHDEIIHSYVENLKTDTSRIGCKTVLLYPYAHLSHILGSPRKAKEFLLDLKTMLEKEGLNVEKSPFGWYKAFGLQCKGHPLAEAYREY